MKWTIQDAIARLFNRGNLSREESARIFRAIMAGQCTDAQIGAFLAAMRMKGETADEIAGAAEAMRESATRIDVDAEPLIDTCGTGGDGLETFNISTATALVVAGAGVHVAKHGNRAASSRSGSADVLAALGVDLDAPPERVARCIEQAGVGFLYAVRFHGAMRHAVGPRREIRARTIFNLLGPLTNPAGARRQLVGVFHVDWVEPVAQALGSLGAERVMVVAGADGMDEITLTDLTAVAEWDGRAVRCYELAPEDAGLDRCDPKALAGGDAERNAAIIRSILGGERGAPRDITLLNAAAALRVAGVAEDLREGVARAAEAIDSGSAQRALASLVRLSHER
ncbi:MAG: anthranilate phosphoribosyltransferase [Myxococcales bacterium]|nr:anthranilate phosphoribosyltransferase [Myxococcales bacterium]